MKKLIPSIQVREYLESINYELNDFQKSTLIWNSIYYNHKTIIDELKKLSRSTNDFVLRKQILQRLEFETKSLEKMKADSKNCYYVISDDNGCLAYFMKFENAIKCCKDNNCHFIEKRYFPNIEIDSLGYEIGEFNSYLFPDREFVFPKNVNRTVGYVYLDSNFDIKDICCYEFSKAEKAIVSPFNPKRFEYAYTPIPIPKSFFDKGIKVIDISSNEVGTVATTYPQWQKFLSSVNNGRYVDFSDYCITVMPIDSSNTVCHEHINPIYLDIIE